jgi:hypothetical protein
MLISKKTRPPPLISVDDITVPILLALAGSLKGTSGFENTLVPFALCN